MARTYWRVSPAFWADEKVTGAEGGAPWSDDAKMLALYLLTCEHRTAEGLFRLPKGYIIEDLGWDTERLAEPFAQLLRDGFIEYDGRARLCFIVNALEYQAPENPNQITFALKSLGELPKSPLLARLLAQAERLCKPFAERLREALAEGFAKPPTPPPPLPPTPPIKKEERAGTRGTVDNFSRKVGGRGRKTDPTEYPGADREPSVSEPILLGGEIAEMLGALRPKTPPDDLSGIDFGEAVGT